MADIADMAQAYDEVFGRVCLLNSRREIPKAIATGRCLFCEASLTENKRWCGVECRDDWEILNNES